MENLAVCGRDGQHCEKVIILEAKMSVMEEWKEEVTEQLKSNSQLLLRLQALAIMTLLSVIGGLGLLYLTHLLGGG